MLGLRGGDVVRKKCGLHLLKLGLNIKTLWEMSAPVSKHILLNIINSLVNPQCLTYDKQRLNIFFNGRTADAADQDISVLVVK